MSLKFSLYLENDCFLIKDKKINILSTSILFITKFSTTLLTFALIHSVVCRALLYQENTRNYGLSLWEYILKNKEFVLGFEYGKKVIQCSYLWLFLPPLVWIRDIALSLVLVTSICSCRVLIFRRSHSELFSNLLAL